MELLVLQFEAEGRRQKAEGRRQNNSAIIFRLKNQIKKGKELKKLKGFILEKGLKGRCSSATSGTIVALLRCPFSLSPFSLKNGNKLKNNQSYNLSNNPKEDS